LRYFTGIEELAKRRVTIQKPTEDNPNPDIVSLKALDDIPRGDIILNDLQRRFSFSFRMSRKAYVEEHLKNTDGQRYNAFISGQGFHASAWCDVVPRHSTFVMDNDAFAGAIRRRIQISEPHIYNAWLTMHMHKSDFFRSLRISCSTLFTFRSTKNYDT
jgi:hypothetical protein